MCTEMHGVFLYCLATKLGGLAERKEILKAAIYKSGVPITEIAKRMGKSRRWMYLMFENSMVSLDVVLQIGKLIHMILQMKSKNLILLQLS